MPLLRFFEGVWVPPHTALYRSVRTAAMRPCWRYPRNDGDISLGFQFLFELKLLTAERFLFACDNFLYMQTAAQQPCKRPGLCQTKQGVPSWPNL